MIWAKGLRNPFTFAIQPGTGRIFINDVGEGTWEEINDGIAGANYGWPNTEGPTSNPAYVAPLFAYRHSGATNNPSLLNGFAIAGGAFYNPGTVMFPSNYVGNYFFADFVSRWIARLDLANNNAVYQFAKMPADITDLAVGPDGALYALAYVGSNWGVFRYSR
jgi:glucose/arabinose dehydrogenase